jgi:meso-butanediol dehydrogenase/(S,S)-butanediol dehydrogenase/diacetyl reductase
MSSATAQPADSRNIAGRLAGKVVVIVGGATGFGLATSQRFAAEGATVAILGRRLDLASAVGESVGGSGHECDITDFHQLESVTVEVMERYGAIHAAVNYAGFERNTPIRDLTPEIR